MSCVEEQRLAEYSDHELLQFIHASPSVSDDPREQNVLVISPNLIAKGVSNRLASDELAGIHLAQQLGIRVPDIKRVVPHNDGVYIIMDRIRGSTLEQSWSKISWVTTTRMAFQLRRFVLAMRKRTSREGGGLVTGRFLSIWVDDFFELPPRATPAAVTSYITFWLQYQKTNLPEPRRTSSPSTPHSLQI
jgi:hypothetical protein